MRCNVAAPSLLTTSYDTACVFRGATSLTTLSRHFTQDNWNILDTSSIAFILVAFTFRLLAFGHGVDTEQSTMSALFENANDESFVGKQASVVGLPPLACD